MFDLYQETQKKILILDGAWGTMFQHAHLSETDFRFEGDDPQRRYKGNFDLLQLTRPDVVRDIHRAYFAAGADITSTNTFNSTRISQADYGTEALAYTLNETGARLAREVADELTHHDHKPRWVAGVLGPTNRIATVTDTHATSNTQMLSQNIQGITYNALVNAYDEAIRGLMAGGANLLLIETAYHAQNTKAALFAAQQVFVAEQRTLPIMLSGTISTTSGTMPDGQTLESFIASTKSATLFSLGLNCIANTDALSPFLERIGKNTHALVSVHPHAGFPDALGEYHETPEYMANTLAQLARKGLVNIVGGCCGTTPEHIYALATAVDGIDPRIP